MRVLIPPRARQHLVSSVFLILAICISVCVSNRLYFLGQFLIHRKIEKVKYEKFP